MSRSYKKSRIIKMAKSKFAKDFANKRLRKVKDLGNGCNYKKYNESWDICDCRFYVEKNVDAESIWASPNWWRK